MTGNEKDWLVIGTLMRAWNYTDLSGNGNNGTINGATWSTVRLANTNNCTATDDIVVTVNPLPAIDLGADTTLICAGTSETLDAGTGFASYLWSDGSTNQTLSATTAGTYTVTGTDANGCTASDSMVIDVLTVDITQNDTTICEGDSLVLDISLGDEYFKNWNLVPFSGGALNIIKNQNEFFVRTDSDIFQMNSLNSNPISENFSSQVNQTPGGRLLGITPNGYLLTSTAWECVYRKENGIWSSVGLCGYG